MKQTSIAATVNSRTLTRHSVKSSIAEISGGFAGALCSCDMTVHGDEQCLATARMDAAA